MIPVRRCGSHALRLRLNFSREFYSPYPLHIVDFMPLVELYGDLVDDNAYFQLIVDIISRRCRRCGSPTPARRSRRTSTSSRWR
jgi:hypothetical protein